MIESLCNIRLGGINHDKTILQDGDVLLIGRLKYRVTADMKGRDRVKVEKRDVSEFVFYKGSYKEA